MAVDRRAAEAPKDDRTDLEVWLRVKGPDFLRKNAANLLLAVAVVIAVIVFFAQRRRGREAEVENARQNLAAAYDSAAQLRDLGAKVPGDAAARERQRLAYEAQLRAEVAASIESATPAQKARALLVKADVAWTLSRLPDAALATTRPVANFTTRPAAGYLDDAESGYKQVLAQYPDEPSATAPALLGLAAVSEERGNFDDAAKWYQNAIDEKSIAPTFRAVAVARLAMLDKLRAPLVIAAPATQPTTRAADENAATPTTSATTQPAVPPLLARPAATQP